MRIPAAWKSSWCMTALICSVSLASIAVIIASIERSASFEMRLVLDSAWVASVWIAVSTASRARSLLGLNSLVEERREVAHPAGFDEASGGGLGGLSVRRTWSIPLPIFRRRRAGLGAAARLAIRAGSCNSLAISSSAPVLPSM